METKPKNKKEQKQNGNFKTNPFDCNDKNKNHNAMVLHTHTCNKFIIKSSHHQRKQLRSGREWGLTDMFRGTQPSKYAMQSHSSVCVEINSFWLCIVRFCIAHVNIVENLMFDFTYWVQRLATPVDRRIQVCAYVCV